MRKRWVWPALGATLLVQIWIIGAMLYGRIVTLRDGQEIVIRSSFVDPRDIFRGHYVRLNPDLLPRNQEDDSTFFLEWNNKSIAHYVELEKDTAGFWVAKDFHEIYPKTEAPVLKATSIYGNRTTLRITLPFDRYFAPEFRAKELENLRREQRLGIVLALDGKGGGIIKGITVDGERLYDEPLL